MRGIDQPRITCLSFSRHRECRLKLSLKTTSFIYKTLEEESLKYGDGNSESGPFSYCINNEIQKWESGSLDKVCKGLRIGSGLQAYHKVPDPSSLIRHLKSWRL